MDCETEWRRLNEQIAACRPCARLVQHCQAVAREKRAAYRDCEYWGRPVPNFGSASARLLIVGLAPGAHGANRTGRVFTGDSSGDWLYRAMHRSGFANQAEATAIDDGLKLIDCTITGVGHCAPPQNKLTVEEIAACRPWLEATVELMSRVKVFLTLGSIAWRETTRLAQRRQWHTGKLPKFGHGEAVRLTGGRWLLGSYHPSRQNTNTGVLTEAMLDAVFAQARQLLNRDG